ncbi:MAG: hypothetical protein ACK47U_05015 [Verrucomicrobiota bacterium]|jgi:hypothetical protein|nr:hypothetical protein [Verrucomicrobiota bacterium]NBN94831.1 hypothetical protein [Verrucomicrobiota bacterium]
MSNKPIDELMSAWQVSPRRCEDFSRDILRGPRPSPVLRVSAVAMAVFLVGGLAGWRSNNQDSQQMAKLHARSIVEASAR